MKIEDARLLSALFNALRFEIRATAPDVTPTQREKLRKSSNEMMQIIEEACNK